MIKNKFILKSISLFLSFWMLMASTGFSVSYHYCEGEVVNWSVINDTDSCDHEKVVEVCCEEEAVKACHVMMDHELKSSDCCNSDKASVVLESEFNLAGSEIEFSLPQLIVISQFIMAFSNEGKEQIEYLNYEIPVLMYRQEEPFIQSFLL